MESLLDTGVEIVKKAKNSGASEVEVFLEANKEISIMIESNEIKAAESQEINGAGIRIFKNKSLGFSSVNSLNQDKINTAIENSMSLANVSIKDDFNELPLSSKIEFVKEIYDGEAEKFQLEQALKFAKDLLKTAKDYDNRVTVDRGIFNSIISKYAVVNSKGVKVEEKKSIFIYYIMGMAINKKEVSCFSFKYDGTCKVREINVEKVALDFAESVVDSLGAKKGESFKGTILLSPEEFNLLGSVITSSVNADNIQKGMSKFAGKIGSKIASEFLTIEDNGFLDGKVSSCSFDREGVIHKPLKIIENGILNSYLYNTYTAKKDKRNSTGHATGGYRTLPSIGPLNIIVKPGCESKDELIKGIKKGILVTRFSGFPNPITGDFSGVVKGGFLIENGSIKCPIIETLIAGNVFELLNNISGVSEETKEMIGSVTPYIRIEDVSITGE